MKNWVCRVRRSAAFSSFQSFESKSSWMLSVLSLHLWVKDSYLAVKDVLSVIMKQSLVLRCNTTCFALKSLSLSQRNEMSHSHSLPVFCCQFNSANDGVQRVKMVALFVCPSRFRAGNTNTPLLSKTFPANATVPQREIMHGAIQSSAPN